jgi:ADP-ribosyl-[dinitrogen reductase] hydrolase
MVMLGTIIGDIIGSVYEFKNYRRKDFNPLFHPQARFTDDTVCTVAVADALVRGADPQATLIDWCRRYAENGGWGKRFAEWFMDNDPQPYGSWGNGAAMRISPVGLLVTSEDEAIAWSDAATAITHNHPDGIASARAVALAIYWGRQKTDPQIIATRLSERFGYDLSTTPDDIRPTYTRTESAAGSVPQAIVCALQSTSYEDAIRNAVSIGGDSDTIAAIAGGIAEALHGLPEGIAQQGWEFLKPEMQRVLRALYAEVHA